MSSSSRDESQLSWQQSIYDYIHDLAQAALARERPGNSLQPTLLANDAYLKLLQQRNIDPTDRSQVLAAGAMIIRRLLVDYARKRKSLRRGGTEGRGEPLHIEIAADARFDGGDDRLGVLELDQALESLDRQNSRAAKVVELRFFGGLTGAEIAEELGISLRTVNYDWRFAKAWLYRELQQQVGPES